MSVKTKKRTPIKLQPKKVVHKKIVRKKEVPKIITETKNDSLQGSEYMFKKPVSENPIIEQNIMEEKNIVIEKPVSEIQTPEIKTISSSSMLDDLMGETDKDNEAENTNDNSNDDIFSEITENKTDEKISEPNTTGQNIGDKVADTLSNEAEDWQNPTDFRKSCALKALMYTEVGAIILSFLGQAISGDWTPEGENKYMPSEERRKLIRNPLAKKFELNPDRSKSSPTGALITAIVFTVIPIVIVAFKDRKKRVEIELKNIENIRLKKELEIANNEMEELRREKNIPMNKEPYIPLSSFLVKKQRGRHKANCDCEKCNLKKVKSKK